ncbi:MAG: TetR/AcrR family transcriptional regulator [Candidatus Binatia bacterium]
MRPSALRVKSAVKARREEEKRLRRQDILAAAKQVYSHKGFLGATIEDIAAAARVSVGAIYLYYKSKEDLYVSLLSETMESFTRELTRIRRSRWRADRKLRAAWEFFYRFQQEFPESYRVFFLFHHKSFPVAVPRETLAMLNRSAGRNFAIAAEIVREGMEAGIYRPGQPREVVDLLWSMFMGLVHLSETRANLGLTTSTLAELHRRAFDWFEAGLRSPQPLRAKTSRGRVR